MTKAASPFSIKSNIRTATTDRFKWTHLLSLPCTRTRQKVIRDTNEKGVDKWPHYV